MPRDVAGDVRDYPLARDLVLLAVAAASEAVIRLLDGDRDNWSATLRDCAIQLLESAGPVSP